MKQKEYAELVKSGWSANVGGYVKSLWVKYRTTEKRYDEIYAEQGKVCPGCLQGIAHALDTREPEGLKAFPDFDDDWPRPAADTGARGNGYVRGLLCKTCKTLLGELEWDLYRTKNLMKYLERNGK